MITDNKRTLKILALILLVAFLFRAYHLSIKEQGTDEGWTIEMIKQVLSGTFFDNVGTHAHPPLFYIILSPFWVLTGGSILFLRYLMVIFGLTSIVLTFILARKFFGKNVALLSSALLAFSPFHIIYSQHLRSYIFLMSIVLFSLYLLNEYIVKQEVKTLAILVVIYILAFYIHTFAALFVISHFLILLLLKFLRISEIKLKPVLVSGIFVAFGWILWLPAFIQQYKFNITEGAITGLTKLNPMHIPYTFYKYAVAIDFSSALRYNPFAIIIAALLSLILFYGAFLMYKRSYYNFILVSCSLLLPVLILAVMGIFYPLYSFRYLSYLAPLFMIILAKGFLGLPNKKMSIAIFIATLIVWISIIIFYWSDFVQYKWGYNFAI